MLCPRALVVLFALVFCSASKPFRPRGPDPIGTPNWNLTSISTSSARGPTAAAISSVTTTTAVSASSDISPPKPSGLPPYPISGTGTWPGISDGGGRPKPTDHGTVSPPFPVNSTNSTRLPCTVNIPSATIDWWFPATYDYPLGRFTRYRGNTTEELITLIPNSVPFDPTSALETDLAYTEVITYDPEFDATWTFLEEYTVRPSATVTSVVTRTAVRPLPSNNIIPAEDYLLYNVNAEPASVAITGATGTVFAATSTTPVLYFSAYEVETALPVTAPDGRVKNSTTTETVTLANPYALPYWVKGIEDVAVATGAVPEEFLAQIPESACAPGNVQATITVLFVVNLFYINFIVANPFIVHIESSVFGFDDPTPTEDPNVNVQNTGKPTKKPGTLQTKPPPKIEQSVPVTSDNPAPTPTPSGSDDINAQGSLGPGPNPPEPSSQQVGTIGTAPVVVGPSSVVVVGSQTLNPGGPAVTVGGVPVSLAPSATAIVIGGTTSRLPNIFTPANNPRPPPILTIGSSTLTANAATQFFIAPGQTLTPGGTATVGGTVVSLGPSASFVVIGGSTQVLPTAAPAVTQRPEIIVGGSTFTANSGSSFVIQGQTLAPGQAITVDGTTISLAPSASFAVVGGSTQLFPAAGTGSPVITVGGSTFTADSGSSFTIGGQTLAPGQQITVDGTTISLAPSASFVVINGATSTLTNAAAQITPPPLTIGNGVFTAIPGPGTTYIIGGYYLTPGGVITVADSTISLAPGATALVINGQTTYLSPGAAPITNAPLLTIGSQTYTAVSGTTFIIGGQTLTPGGTITVDGTTITLAPGATELVYGSSGHSTTTALFPATTTRSQSITGTAQASAGATGLSGGPAQTGQHGAGSALKASGFESWLLSICTFALSALLW